MINIKLIKEKEKEFLNNYDNQTNKKACNYISAQIFNKKLKPISEKKCAFCGNKAEMYHHPDYNKKDYVIPLCTYCHNKEHLRIKNNNININKVVKK